MRNKILIPKLSMFGLPMRLAMTIAANAGFDGMEILATGFTKRWFADYDQLAHRLGLKLHLHQVSSVEENPTHWFSHVLSLMRYFPRDGYNLDEIVPAGAEDVPFVIYADRWQDAIGHPERWVQSTSTFNVDVKYKISYHEFVKMVVAHNLPVVFDTQHVLEYYLNCRGVEGLPADRGLLLSVLEKCWQDLGRFTVEVHFNDSLPKHGHTHGRNVFPGTGVLPLSDFGAILRQTHWNGLIVPEVSPIHLFPFGVSRLRTLHQTVEQILSP